MSKKDFYLPPADFFDEVVRSKQKGRVTKELGEMFKMLAEKIANHRYWIRYGHLRNDIISENMLSCMKGFDYFEPYNREGIEQSGGKWNGEDVVYSHLTCNNPHAWFTTCCFNGLKQMMKKEYQQSNINNKVRLSHGLDASFGYTDMINEQEQQDRDSEEIDIDDEDDSDDFVEQEEEEPKKQSPIEW